LWRDCADSAGDPVNHFKGLVIVPAMTNWRMSKRHDRWNLGAYTMRRISISFELGDSRSYDDFFRRLACLGAVPLLKSQWVLQTHFTIEQVEKDLRARIDPADRLLVTYVGAMSSRNLINREKFGNGPI
jgi:hypothetical protein